MPSKNIYKDYVENSYYHIYNRGVAKGPVFLDEQDYAVFLSFIKRYLSAKVEKNMLNVDYPNYYNRVELMAFCLMPNHFHLFVYQHDAEAMKQFMKSLSVAYCMYFNKKYKRVGPLFQQRYKAVRITDDSQLLHITRYIHLNPPNYKTYEWTSLPYYLNKKHADWMRPGRVLELFNGGYETFVDDYKSYHDEFTELKHVLADS